MQERNLTRIAATIGLLALVAAAPADPAEAPSAAWTLYLRECAPCHGGSGRGDGPIAGVAGGHPGDLTRPGLWRAYDDEELAVKVLVGVPLRLDAAGRERLGRDAGEIESFLRGLAGSNAREGARLYAARCLPCHDRYGRPEPSLPEGVQRPPRDLSDPAFQGSIGDRELENRMRSGHRKMPAPVPRLTTSEADSVVDWVRLLASPGFVRYDAFCARCHGLFGEGAPSSPVRDPRRPRIALDAAFFRQRTDEEVDTAITHMLRDQEARMPHLSGTLTLDDVRRIIAGLRGRFTPGN